MDVEVVEAIGDVVLVTVGLPGVVTTEVWGVAVGVVRVVVGGSGVEDGVGCVDGSGAGGVLLCTGLEEGDTGVELGVVITKDGVEEGGAEEGEGSVAVIPANGSRLVP